MADSWPSSSYSYRDTGSFCHHVFKQNVIPAIRLSFLAALSQRCEKVQWLIVLLPKASRPLCACAFSHVLHPLPECSTHHSQLCSFFLQQHEEEPLCYFGCMNVSMRCYAFATGLFIFARVRRHLLYLRGSPCFHATLGPSLCPCERFLHLPPKTNPPTFCDNFTGFFSVRQNVFGWEPARFARQVILLCSLA